MEKISREIETLMEEHVKTKTIYTVTFDAMVPRDFENLEEAKKALIALSFDRIHKDNDFILKTYYHTRGRVLTDAKLAGMVVRYQTALLAIRDMEDELLGYKTEEMERDENKEK